MDIGSFLQQDDRLFIVIQIFEKEIEMREVFLEINNNRLVNITYGGLFTYTK